MRGNRSDRRRQDVSTAAGDGRARLAIDRGVEPRNAAMEQALYWQQIYIEIVAMEAKAMEVIQDLMANQSPVLKTGWN